MSSSSWPTAKQDRELNDAVVRNLAAKDVKSLPPTDLKDYQAKIVDEDIAASNKHIHQAIQRNWIHLFFPSNDEQWSHSGSHRSSRAPAGINGHRGGWAGRHPGHAVRPPQDAPADRPAVQPHRVASDPTPDRKSPSR